VECAKQDVRMQSLPACSQLPNHRPDLWRGSDVGQQWPVGLAPQRPIRRISLIAMLSLSAAVVSPAAAGPIIDGSFETQAVLQNTPYVLQPDGQKYGAGWNNWGWSSWQGNRTGAWIGGAIARTEEFAAGWK
jgi:hypothetical protein